MTIPEAIGRISLWWKKSKGKRYFIVHCFWVGHKHTSLCENIKNELLSYRKCKCGDLVPLDNV